MMKTTKEAAKEIRRDLKKMFPGIKFSVRMHMNSIRIYWNFGPTEQEVIKATNKYLNGHFNGMTDSYEFDYSKVGGAKFIFCNRDYGNLSNYERLLKKICRKVLTDQKIEYNEQNLFDLIFFWGGVTHDPNRKSREFAKRVLQYQSFSMDDIDADDLEVTHQSVDSTDFADNFKIIEKK